MKAQWLLCAAALTLAGCRAPLLVDLSPDGRTVAMGTAKGLTLNPVGEEPGRIIYNGDSSNPRWSPDGSKIAFIGNGRVRIHDIQTGRTDVLPTGLEGPIGWADGGRELLITNPKGPSIKIYHLASQELVRSVTIPFEPTVLAVPKSGRGFAVAKQDVIAVWSEGKMHTIPVEGWIDVFAYTPEGDLTWVAARASEPDKPEHFALMQWDPHSGAKALREFDLPTVLDVGHRPASLSSIAFSPNGQEIGLLAVVDSSPPGVSHRLDELKAKQKPSQAEMQEVYDLVPKLKYDLVFARMNLLDGASEAQTWTRATPGIAYSQVAWSGDGKSVALVSEQHVKIISR